MNKVIILTILFLQVLFTPLEILLSNVCKISENILESHSKIHIVSNWEFLTGLTVMAAENTGGVSIGNTEQKAVTEAVSPKYEKANRKNPFIPIVTNDGQLINIREGDEDSSLVLEGIIYDKDGQSMAMINGQILRKNDSVGDAKIVEIRKDSVVYIKDGEIFILNASRKE